ncbi:MAG: hypothetical protein LBG89_02060 [Rickettsiales bacterium]|jgi:dCTP deaminase|nr:hypothetical protein [Rickettsiales bacterium]
MFLSKTRFNEILDPNSPEFALSIQPLAPNYVGADSIDFRLGETFAVYENSLPRGIKPWTPVKSDGNYSFYEWYESPLEYVRDIFRPAHYAINPKYALDPAKKRKTIEIKIPETGLIVRPGVFYLAHLYEFTAQKNVSGLLEGLSGMARNSVKIHFTAPFVHSGQGWDKQLNQPKDGKGQQLTLEIECSIPTILYPRQKIAQMYFFETPTDLDLYSGKHSFQSGATASRMNQEMQNSH